MRYRTRRHKLGSQGTGDAAGFTISPPAIALFSLFLSHTLTTTHSLHLTLALRDRSRPFSLFLSNSLSQRGSYANSRLSRTVRRELLPPRDLPKESWRQSGGRKTVSSCGFSESRFRRDLESGTSEITSWIYKIRARRMRNGNANEGTETHFLRSLHAIITLRRESTRMDECISGRKGFPRRNRSRLVSFAGERLRILRYLLPLPFTHTRTRVHTYTSYIRTHLHQEKMPRVRAFM